MNRVLFILTLMFTVCASAHAAGIRFILVGDSTVAEKSGWGPGFCHDVASSVTCVNLAQSGRSTKSYREGGAWAKVLSRLKDNAAYRQTYVLIQFGHNDQPGKPGRSTDVKTEFPANMKAYAEEVKATGARPILVTPLARRSFDADGRIHDTFGPWVDADRQVAAEEKIPLLNLNADSIAALEKMGKAEADTLAMAPPPDKSASVPTVSLERNGEAAARFDGTHLGTKGAAFFARIVENELTTALPETKGSFSTQ